MIALQLTEKQKFENLNCKKNSRGLLETTEKSAKSAQSARAYFNLRTSVF